MSTTNITCRKPEICGVKTHRPGTVAECMKPGSGRNQAVRGAGSIAATPQLLNKSGFPTGTWSPEVHEIADAAGWSEDAKSRDIRVGDNVYAEPELYEVTTPDQIKPGDMVVLVDPNASYGETLQRVGKSGPDNSDRKLGKIRWRNVVDSTDNGSLVIQRMDEQGKSWPYRPELASTEGKRIMRAVDESTGQPLQFDASRYDNDPELAADRDAAKAVDGPEFQLKSKATAALLRVGLRVDPHKLDSAQEVDPGVYLVEGTGAKVMVFDNAQVTSKSKITGYLQRDNRKDAPFEFVNGLWKDEGSTDTQPDLSGGDFGDGHRWSTPYASEGPRQAVKDKYGSLL